MPKSQEKAELEFKALGTDIYFQLVFEKEALDAKKDLADLQAFYLLQEKIFSRFDVESELSFLNANLGKFHPVSADFLQVAKKSLDYNQMTRGLFDPRIIETLEKIGYQKDFKTLDLADIEIEDTKRETLGELEKDLIIKDDKIKFLQRMDFSGIAKGYITDRAGAILQAKKYTNFLLDSGGDMLASGMNQESATWKIDIEGVAERRLLLGLKNEAIATSGIGKRKWESGGKRFHHLINPRDLEKFSFDLQSVTVVASNVTEADIWAKVLFLMGKENGQKLAQEKELKSIFLDYRGNAWISSELKRNNFEL
ncbi:MAG: FAD:protein FMN transferase [Candidatus Moraniibacteriota bacterium]